MTWSQPAGWGTSRARSAARGMPATISTCGPGAEGAWPRLGSTVAWLNDGLFKVMAGFWGFRASSLSAGAGQRPRVPRQFIEQDSMVGEQFGLAEGAPRIEGVLDIADRQGLRNRQP